MNVHPTKREVHFLNEEDITDQIADAVQEKLAEKGQSRAYEYHQVHSLDDWQKWDKY